MTKEGLEVLQELFKCILVVLASLKRVSPAVWGFSAVLYSIYLIVQTVKLGCESV